MKYKGLILGAAFTGAVAAPIIATVAASADSYKENDYKVTFTTPSPIKTLNLFKAISLNSFDQAAGYFTSALTRGRPTGAENGGLETALSIGAMAFDINPIANADDIRSFKDDNVTPKEIDSKFTDFNAFRGSSITLPSASMDLAEKMTAYKYNNKIMGIGYQMREQAKFWNGDRVTAEDFAKTYMTILDQKNAVPYANVMLSSFMIHNSKEVWKYQTEGHTFEEAIAKYPLGISYAEEIPEEELATSDEGKEYFKKEYAAGHKRHLKLILSFDQDATMFLTGFSSDAISSPTSIRFFDKIGIDNYGTSIDTIMGAGPYKPVYADLDYKLVANKWQGYWDAKHVVSPQVELRVIQDQSSSITLFKTGVIGSVTFGTSLLPQFMGSAELRKSVKTTSYADSLDYIPLNINPNREASKYLIDQNLRKALFYSINRKDYLHAYGADNSYSPEGFATQQNMQDAAGKTPANYLYEGHDYLGNSPDKFNSIKTIDGTEEEVISRDPLVSASTDPLKNGLDDRIHNVALAKEYYAAFKADHPEFTGVSLKWLFGSSLTEMFLTIKQSIETTLPGVSIELFPKPDNIVEAQISKGDWDISNRQWPFDYKDSWTDYHLVAEKVTRTDSDDVQTSSRIRENVASDGYSLVDFVVQKINEDPNYFKDTLHVDNSVIAQYLRMVTIVNNLDPSGFDKANYDSAYWDQKPNKDNDFRGYGGEFDKWGKLLGHDTSGWGEKAKQFITDNSVNGAEADLWKIEGYRNSIVYPAIEKLIKDSGVGIILKHLQNQYIASRLIGRVNFANAIQYLGFVYQTNKIPPISLPLPGKDSVG